MSELSFTAIKKNVLFEVSLVNPHEFDVREEAGKDQGAVDELVMQGTLLQLPLLTTDGVIIDGRTGFEAAKILEGIQSKDGKSTKPADFVHVDVVGFAWKNLSSTQQRQVIAESLRRNLPKQGFSRIATQADMLQTAKQFLEHGATKPEAVQLLIAAGVSRSRAEKLGGLADNEVTNFQIRNTLAYAAEHDVTPSQATKALKYPEKILPKVQAYGKSGPDGKAKISRPQSTSYVRTAQAELTKALATVKRYNDTNLKKFLDSPHRYSGKFVVDVADIHVRTAHKILAQAQRSADRIRTEVNKRVPANHRF